MRTIVACCLALGLGAAEEAAFAKYSVVYYHEHRVVDGQPVERSRALILTDLRATELLGAPFLVGTVPEGLKLDAGGTRVHLRGERVYLVMGTDSEKAAKVLLDAAAEGIWRQVTE